MTSINKVIDFLRTGGVIAHPADTCFGLLGDFMNPAALQKIQAIKGRDGQKPMSVMLPASMKTRLDDWVILDDFARKVCEKLLPGPVTLVLPKGPNVPAHYFPETATLGIRVPEDDATQEILEAFGGPLITTSANVSGRSLCFTDTEVREQFENVPVKPDLILGGMVEPRPASTVILVESGTLKILRQGRVTEQDLKNGLNKP